MKETKLLAVTAILLLTSCSPKVVTHIGEPIRIPFRQIRFMSSNREIRFPTQPKTLGSVSVVDRGYI